MIQETVGNTGKVPREVSADVGYYSAQVVDGLYALGEDPFVAPDQTRHGRVVPPAPRGRIPGRLSPRDRMRAGSCVRKGDGSAMRCGWSRCSGRSRKVGGSGSSCCVAWSG